MSAESKIEVHCHVKGGRLICEKNMDRIVCRSLRVQRICDSSWGRYFDPSTYKETWVIRKHPKKGFIFVEVRHGGGICGFHKTLRGLILATSMMGPAEKEIVVLDKPFSDFTSDGLRRMHNCVFGDNLKEAA